MLKEHSFLKHSAGYIDAALLENKDIKSIIVLLNIENFQMQWGNLEEFKNLTL